MEAILKKIEVPHYDGFLPKQVKHRIKMLFGTSLESHEQYIFETTIEEQFCKKNEYDLKEGISKELLEEKINCAKSLVGKTFDINLYDFTVNELTTGKFIAFVLMLPNFFKPQRVFHIASYMTKEDAMMSLKYTITMRGIQGFLEGVLPDDSTEKITTELFFPKFIREKKNFSVSYNRYSYLTNNYIVNEVAINDICKGCNLAYQIEERYIPRYDFNKYIDQIKSYRSRVITVNAKNKSLIKKIFFWKPKEIVEELKLDPNVISLLRDCIILGKSYPEECEKADLEYAKECENKLRKKYMGEDIDKKEFKQKWTEFRHLLTEKYKDKIVVNIVK